MKECSGWPSPVKEHTHLRDMWFLQRHAEHHLMSIVAFERYGWPTVEYSGETPVAIVVYLRGGEDAVDPGWEHYVPLIRAAEALRIPATLIVWNIAPEQWTFRVVPLTPEGSAYFGGRRLMSELELNEVLHRVRGILQTPAYATYLERRLREGPQGHTGDLRRSRWNFPHQPISNRHRLWCGDFRVVDVDYLLTAMGGKHPFILVEYTQDQAREDRGAGPGEMVLAQLADVLDIPAILVRHTKDVVPKDRTFFVWTMNTRAAALGLPDRIEGEDAWFATLQDTAHALARSGR
jgi:hypothetical protein